MPRSSLCLKPNHGEFHAFLMTKWRFSLFSMTNEIKIASLKCRLFDIILSLNFNFCDYRFWPFQIKKSCILHNTQGIVVKILHMMWIILNICLTTKNGILLTLLSFCSKLLTVCALEDSLGIGVVLKGMGVKKKALKNDQLTSHFQSFFF